ncbi:four helix bundle protein [Hymenobacter cellulosilyticus]|uniref:Four helix bundle protein n=1 Tax=Hymenobacter cellulosilyticus TaxID=2932248 RepID=A0A8T9Q9C6_9BACT|nr:four helix bundle protein [Hymenobacter cellulosilyticus]UOQ73592.1 four helix bundle protein [Hymenobacter cellulosilyticus]
MKADPAVPDNPIVRISFDFALQVLAYVQELEQVRRFVIAQQFLRSGTSIGANVREAQHAESRADFVHKCKVAAKEAAETEYWLLLCKHAPSYPEPPTTLFTTLLDIQRLLSRIISSSKANGTSPT